MKYQVALRRAAFSALCIAILCQPLLWARSFKGAATYATHLAPNSVVVADFNGDGKLDVAVANKNSNDISVLFGNGDGTFQPQVKYPTGGTAPVGIAAADFNGDTKIDLVTVNATGNNVSVFLNSGTGTFGAAVKYAVGHGPSAVVVGDLNGDTVADIAVTNATDGTITVLFNNGSGAFASAGTYATDVNPSAIVMADFDGSGSNDLAVTNQGGNDISVFLNHGNGTFANAVNYCVVNATGSCNSVAAISPVSLVAVDLNGDGRADLGVANLAQQVCTLVNNGSGAFTLNTQSAFSLAPRGISAGDYNGDGKQDLVVADSATNSFVVMNGNGSGGLGVDLRFLSGSAPTAIATGDFNKDGKLDAVVANSAENDIAIILGNGDGTFQDIEEFVSGVNLRAVAIGDYTGDGKVDYLVNSGAGATSSVVLFNGNGKGVFQKFGAVTIGSDVYSVAASDFNQDKKLDFVAAQQNANRISVVLGNGNGTFNATVATYNTDAGPVSVAVGDVNHDGYPDIVTANSTAGTVTVFTNSKTATFNSSASYPAGAAPSAVAVADLNNDGFPDIIVANGSGTLVSVLMNNGAGGFGGPTPFTVGNNPIALAVADLNGDNFLDLVVANKAGNSLSVLLGNGDGSFQTAVPYTLPNGGPAAVSVADITAEGIPDIVVAQSSSNVIGILQGNGDGTFLGSVNYKVGVTPNALATGDVTGDGKADVLAGNLAGGDVTALLNVNPSAAMSASPTKLTFGNLQVGSTSTSQNITLQNKGNTALSLYNIQTSADYPMTTTCGTTLGSLASCTITVQFQPTVPLAIAGQLTIQGSVSGNFLIIPLTGTGQFPMVVSPVSMNLGSVAVGSTTTPQTVTVTNQTSTAISFTTSATGNYQAVGNGSTPCTGALAGGASCTVAVTLTPTQSGAINGSFIVSGAGFLPQITSLSGTATGNTTQLVTFSPASLLFDSPALGFSSLPKTVTATNSSASAVNLTLTPSQDWSVNGFGSKPCGGALAAGAQCQFQVVFTPSVLGYFNGSISISTGSGNPIIYNLEGLGNIASSFSPGSMNFGTVPVGSTSAGQVVKVWNFENDPMQVIGWYASGSYNVVPGGTQPCSTSVLVPPLLKPYCNLVVTFTPRKVGAIPGAITVITGWSTGATSFAVTGSGQ